jgi:hypothetical protein
MARFRQSYWGANPPVGPFEINRASMQGMGLVGWYPPGAFPNMAGGIPNMAGGDRAAVVGSLGWVYDPVMGWGPDYVASTANYINCGNSPALNPTTAMSITAWINADSVAEQYLVDRDSETGRSYSMRIYANRLYLLIGITGLLGGLGPILETGKTYLLGVSGNATQGWTGYTNGVYFGAGAWVAPSATTTTTKIGRGGYSGYEAPYNGRVGDVRIYNRALSGAEHWQLYDPQTRWELYKPLQRMWAVGAIGTPPAGGSARSWVVWI